MLKLKVKLQQQQEVVQVQSEQTQVLIWGLNPNPTLTRLLYEIRATEQRKSCSYLVTHSLSIAYKSGKVFTVQVEKVVGQRLVQEGVAPPPHGLRR